MDLEARILLWKSTNCRIYVLISAWRRCGARLQLWKLPTAKWTISQTNSQPSTEQFSAARIRCLVVEKIYLTMHEKCMRLRRAKLEVRKKCVWGKSNQIAKCMHLFGLAVTTWAGMKCQSTHWKNVFFLGSSLSMWKESKCSWRRRQLGGNWFFV